MSEIDDPAPANWRDVLQGAVFEYDRNTCTHDELRRGGTIWTICCECGAKWADDEGGFVPHQDPPAIATARQFLAARASLNGEAP